MNSEKTHQSSKKIILVVVALIITALAFFSIGYQVAEKRITAKQSEMQTQTFYAEITSIHDTQCSVTGLEVNDVNHRGAFEFELRADTALIWNGTTITSADLAVGERVAITYRGAVLEIYPAVLEEVTEVQLLEDEK